MLIIVLNCSSLVIFLFFLLGDSLVFGIYFSLFGKDFFSTDLHIIIYSSVFWTELFSTFFIDSYY